VHVSSLNNPMINDVSKRYHLRRESSSAEARRKRGGRLRGSKTVSAEARGSWRKRGGGFAEVIGADINRHANVVF